MRKSSSLECMRSEDREVCRRNCVKNCCITRIMTTMKRIYRFDLKWIEREHRSVTTDSLYRDTPFLFRHIVRDVQKQGIGVAGALMNQYAKAEKLHTI